MKRNIFGRLQLVFVSMILMFGQLALADSGLKSNGAYGFMLGSVEDGKWTSERDFVGANGAVNVECKSVIGFEKEKVEYEYDVKIIGHNVVDGQSVVEKVFNSESILFGDLLNLKIDGTHYGSVVWLKDKVGDPDGTKYFDVKILATNEMMSPGCIEKTLITYEEEIVTELVSEKRAAMFEIQGMMEGSEVKIPISNNRLAVEIKLKKIKKMENWSKDALSDMKK